MGGWRWAGGREEWMGGRREEWLWDKEWGEEDGEDDMIERETCKR